MKNKFAFALAGLLAISTAAFAADGRDHGYRSGDYRGGYHQDYRAWGGDHYRGNWGGGAYFGVAPSYGYSYVAPAPYVDPYAYTAPAPYVDQYAAPFDAYVGPAPYPGAIWIGGYWGFGPHGRYWIRGHWGHRR